jgi:hypothetical protein
VDVEYEIEVTKGRAVVRFVVRPTVEGVAAAAHEMAAHPEFTPATPTVWDLSRAPAANLDADGMRRLAPLVASIRDGANRPRVAIVSPQDANFAGARMFRGLNEPRLNAELAVFRDFDEAAAWAFGEGSAEAGVSSDA